jgi:hypothetical protein
MFIHINREVVPSPLESVRQKLLDRRQTVWVKVQMAIGPDLLEEEDAEGQRKQHLHPRRL